MFPNGYDGNLSVIVSFSQRKGNHRAASSLRLLMAFSIWMQEATYLRNTKLPSCNTVDGAFTK